MNWLIALAVFVPLVFVLQWMLPFWVADGIAIVVVFCFFFFYLQHRAIALRCPSCGKLIESNTPWVCGVCGRKNLRVDNHPFVGRCESPECACEPKAYQCHHKGCGKLIFLSRDRIELNFAKCVNTPEPLEPQKKDPVAEKTSHRNSEKAELLHELEVTKIKNELQKEKTVIDTPRIKTLGEKYQEAMKGEDEFEQLKAKIEAEFKDNPVEMEKRLAALRDLARKNLR